MYCQGLGDCFLLTFPKSDGGNFHVLIDCGVILGTPNADVLMKAVIDDIAETTTQIDVLVVTHEHWDHVSGFDPSKEWFKKFTFAEVWLAWTEDPNDAIANRLRQDRSQKLAALWLGIGQMRQRLAADQTTQDTLDRAAEVLSFFGIDPDETPPTGGFDAAAKEAGGRTGAAMRWAREVTKNPKFLRPGATFTLPAGDVRVYVLGPPTDHGQLFKDLPTRAGRETYDDAPAHPAAAMQSFFASALARDQPGMQEAFDTTLPFDRKFQIGEAQAKQSDFFRDHYLGGEDHDPEPWRRIGGQWLAGAAEFALQLDSDTNNTSLALAFELPDGRVLLFPGDAQVGNWESWHAQADGTKRVWTVDERTVDAEALLRRTALYKVGHHGSHNATLRAQGLEMMPDEGLVAMVPVDVYIAHEKKRWTKMPFDPLMSRLKEKTAGHILQADQPDTAPAPPKKASKNVPPAVTDPFLSRVTRSLKEIEVEGPKRTTVRRSLWLEYTLRVK